jgi:beta-lactamase class A
MPTPADPNKARHSRVAARNWPAILLALASSVAVLGVGTVIWLAHSGHADEHASASGSAVRHNSVTASPSSSPAVVSPAVSTRQAAHRDPFGETARSYVATRSGTVQAAAYDETTGQTWTLGPDTPQDEASIIKVDILETLLAQHRPRGTALSASDLALAEEMIEDSDNDAATSLWNEVGGPQGIGTYNASLGLTSTTPSNCVTCAGFAWPGWGLSTTTAADQIALLRELVQPNAHLTETQRMLALTLMERVTPLQRWGVTTGVPLQATVALKNGWLPLTSEANDWQINSIGWISGRGRNYLIAVLTTGDPTEQYGIDTIDELSAIVWRQMR